MPDSPEARLTQVERTLADVRQDVAGVRQRTDDHEGDIRSFTPLVIAHARLEEKLAGIQSGLDSLRKDWRDDVEHFDNAITVLRQEMENDRRDIARVRAEREEKERAAELARREKEKDREIAERRDKIIRWLTFAALVVSAVSSTVAVIAL